MMEEQETYQAGQPETQSPPETQSSGGDAGNLLGTSDPWETDEWKRTLRPDFLTEDGEVNVKALARAYKGAEKRIGSGDIPPKDETGYKIDGQLPDGVEIAAEKMATFLKGAHSKGMTNAQVNWVMGQYGSLITEARQLVEAGKVSAEDVLRQEWGDRYESNLASARKAFHAVATEADIQAMNELGNSPAVMRLLARLGDNLREDPGLPADVTGMGAEDVMVLMKSDAYWDKKHPEHEKTVRRVTLWHESQTRKRAA